MQGACIKKLLRGGGYIKSPGSVYNIWNVPVAAYISDRPTGVKCLGVYTRNPAPPPLHSPHVLDQFIEKSGWGRSTWCATPPDQLLSLLLWTNVIRRRSQLHFHESSSRREFLCGWKKKSTPLDSILPRAVISKEKKTVPWHWRTIYKRERNNYVNNEPDGLRCRLVAA